MDFMTREMLIRKKALAVLGVDEEEALADPRRIRYGYHLRAMKHHPDANPDDPKAHELTALINEAFALLTGKINAPSLLENNELVQILAETPLPDADQAPSYEEWLKEQFYRPDVGSIWQY